MTSMSGSSADQEDLRLFVCYYSEVTWVVVFVKYHRFFLLRLMSFGFFTMLSASWPVRFTYLFPLRLAPSRPRDLRPIIRAYEQIPIRFVEVDLQRALEIAVDHDLYAYDAYIIACARENRCSLISLDKGLLQAARAAGVGFLEVPS